MRHDKVDNISTLQNSSLLFIKDSLAYYVIVMYLDIASILHEVTELHPHMPVPTTHKGVVSI